MQILCIEYIVLIPIANKNRKALAATKMPPAILLLAAAIVHTIQG
jgi:hypothetical protein